jgi:hypothetical protein
VLGLTADSSAELVGWPVPAAPLQLLPKKVWKVNQKPAINGWVVEGSDLPVIVSNASDQAEQIPGRVSPHQVAVHPTPTQFVGVAWDSPIAGRARVQARIAHAHPACGNGIAWWLEHRRAGKAANLAEGTINVGQKPDVFIREMDIKKGDSIILAVDARDGDHACDLTEIALTVTEAAKAGRQWDLAHDISDSILDGNPHADRLGSSGVWRFVQGPTNQSVRVTGGRIPTDSLLARWRLAAIDPKQLNEASGLAQQVEVLLTGSRPTAEKHPDRLLYDLLVSLDSPLLRGLDLVRLHQTHASASKSPKDNHFGLPASRFGPQPKGTSVEADSLMVPATSILEVRLPAALFRDRQFVVDVQLEQNGRDRVEQFQVLTAPPGSPAPLNVKAPYIAAPDSAAWRQLLHGLDAFRRLFPTFICYSRVIPDDEVVCLKLFHREDNDLIHLFLDEDQTRKLNRLWSELRFVSQQPLTENNQLPQFIGYVTQDQPKELLAYFESQRPAFRQRAEEFERDQEKAVPPQLAALIDFASRAYRRPLLDREKTEIEDLFAALRKRKLTIDDAFRIALTRVLVAPSFLFRMEHPQPGTSAEPVSDWELATRLSYFLWASMPDAELRQAAASGHLHEPQILTAQTLRMLQDPKTRGLAMEFATQWLHVKDISTNREKNEKLFPTFNDDLRRAFLEESVLFFQDLFQQDRSLDAILDADYTFVNETLAKHYGIPNIVGPQWRRVDGVRRYGRGGVLGLASILTTQSGASRSSPVLRGNWVVETLLGEKMPKPPPGVPKLPEEESGGEGLTIRQLVEKHAHAAECAVCHQRIDPFGFALEKYDPIGRFREQDLGGRAIDTRAQLKDGTQFEGLDGLRHYLTTQRRQEIQRHFAKKLLGYALGRAVTLSDQLLLDRLVDQLERTNHRPSTAIVNIVLSKQFGYHRGLEISNGESGSHP